MISLSHAIFIVLMLDKLNCVEMISKYECKYQEDLHLKPALYSDWKWEIGMVWWSAKIKMIFFNQWKEFEILDFIIIRAHSAQIKNCRRNLQRVKIFPLLLNLSKRKLQRWYAPYQYSCTVLVDRLSFCLTRLEVTGHRCGATTVSSLNICKLLLVWKHGLPVTSDTLR